MSTTTSTTENNDGTYPFAAAFEQLTQSSEQLLAATRKAGNAYLDSYEKAVDRAIGLELKFAGMTQQEWLKGLVAAQTEFAREFTRAYTSSARALLK
jgi:hypothetical protein